MGQIPDTRWGSEHPWFSEQCQTEAESCKGIHVETVLSFCDIPACVHAQSLQLCQTLFEPMDCSPPGFSVHGILQARILEWVAMPNLPDPGINPSLLLLLHCWQILYLQVTSAVLCLVAQSCLTLCNPMDYIPPGSSVYGDSPGKNRTGLPCPLPGNLPNPEIGPRSPTLQEDSLPLEPPGKPCNVLKVSKIRVLISAREIEIHF